VNKNIPIIVKTKTKTNFYIDVIDQEAFNKVATFYFIIGTMAGATGTVLVALAMHAWHP
jgi:hypothetical protein